ncbi:MAG: AI-2E family transporter [Hyphomicrobiales bacterium]|nr:AI-2E family transporter [Hyphomicrobiales bacterium]
MNDVRQSASAAATETTRSGPVTWIVLGAAVIAVLYYGQIVLVPLSIAIILSFVLSPVIRSLRRWYVPRSLAVILSVFLSALVMLAISVYAVFQVERIVAEVPRYEHTLSRKVVRIVRITGESGIFKKVSATLGRLEKNIAEAEKKTAQDAKPQGNSQRNTKSDGPAIAPIEVVLRNRNSSLLSTVSMASSWILPPLLTLAAVFLFLTFILFQREDLRDRAIRLFGSGDLERTTTTIDDAAKRLSKFLLAQTIINFSYGIVIGIALWAIGVPNAPLWGVLAFLMRYVPFIGSFIAAIPPLLLATAVDPGWSMFWWTLALFAIGEPVMGNIVEPVIQGQTTGMSPLAIVLAAAFWTLLWGPVGLLLAIPLTLCLVVLGRNIEKLEFFEIALGDKPALTPEESFYQRLLAGDADEISDQAEKQLEDISLLTYYDTVARAGLSMAYNNAEEGDLNKERQARIKESVDIIIDNLLDYSTETPDKRDGKLAGLSRRETSGKDGEADDFEDADLPVVGDDECFRKWKQDQSVICLPAHNQIDFAAAELLSHLLNVHGIGSCAIAPDFSQFRTMTGNHADHVKRVVIVSLIRPSNYHRLRFIARRVRRSLPGIPIAICLLSTEQIVAMDKTMLDVPNVQIATSFRDMLTTVIDPLLQTDSSAVSAA